LFTLTYAILADYTFYSIENTWRTEGSSFCHRKPVKEIGAGKVREGKVKLRMTPNPGMGLKAEKSPEGN